MIVASKSAGDLNPGDAMPGSEKTLSSHDLMLYGAATWDWHRLHYDDGFAHEMGLPAPVMDGQIYGAMFAKQATAWLGPKAFIRRLNYRMRAMAFPGDTLRMEGQVDELLAEADGTVAVLRQRVMKGDEVVAEATTEVRLPD
jgi:acyl dehydratase